MCENEVPFDVMFPDLANQVFNYLQRMSTRNGEFRCGVSVGFKDSTGEITMKTRELNPELDDFWGEENANCAPYSGLKCLTALVTEKPSERLPEDMLPLLAIHPGADVRYDEDADVFISVAVSGFSGEEDFSLASLALGFIFFADEEVQE